MNRPDVDPSEVKLPATEINPSSAKPSELFSQALFAEYARLQQQCAHERETRDHRVNWYTLIIGGVVAGYGALSSQFSQAIGDPSLRSFIAILGVTFLLIVGWEVFEAAQRFNLNAIACLTQMQRIRVLLAELEPILEGLHWKGEPSLGHRQPLWIPTVTVTINSFLTCLIAAIVLHGRLVTPAWQAIASFTGVVAAAIQYFYARVRYARLIRSLSRASHENAP